MFLLCWEMDTIPLFPDLQSIAAAQALSVIAPRPLTPRRGRAVTEPAADLFPWQHPGTL